MAAFSSICPSCKSSSHHVVLTKCRDLVFANPGEWNLSECEQCGLVYTVPPVRPEDVIQYYPPSYAPYNPTASLRERPFGAWLRKVAMFPYRIRFGSPNWTERPFGRGRLLDVGCGGGTFLEEASRQGWITFGIDVSDVAVKSARRNAPSASVRVGTLDGLVTDELFDYINLQHVLEHLHDPRRALLQCYAHLAPGGKLRINVPNYGGFESRLFGRSWIGLDMPRHLVHFCTPVLQRLLLDVGFNNVAIRPAMFASSFSESFLLALPIGLRRKLLHSRTARLLYLSMVFPASVSYFFGNVGAIDVTARKPPASSSFCLNNEPTQEI
jgi:SAM-dependent methyltransferase